jgi:CHAT domain-containing protein
MTANPDAQSRIRQYLLGLLADDARQELEDRLLANADFYEELLMVEDELIDEYLAGKLSNEETNRFERHFLATPERHEQLKFGRAFNQYLSSRSAVAIAKEPASGASRGLVAAFFSSRLRFAAYAVVLVGIAVGVWSLFFRQSDVDKAMLALNAAYREARPLESRISDLNYAPYVARRGPGSERVDQKELRRAELILDSARDRNSTPAVYHALGKVYLARKQFDDAIKEFEEALKGDPNNPQLYSDLGAAWLEKGAVDREKEPGKGMEELGRSQDKLSRALELNPNALEAYFNRALCREFLTLYPQAEEDWREYLRRDPKSPWSEEARRHLKLLEEQKAKTSRDKQQLIQDFLAAYEGHNDDAAWAALSRSRARTGNAIVQFLIDDLLVSVRERRTSEIELKFARLSFAGKVEDEKVSDRFTADLASFYLTANDRQRSEASRAHEIMKRGIEHYDKAEWQTGIEFFTQAREVLSHSANSIEALFAEAWIGYCYLRIPDREKASELFQRLAQAFERRKYKSLFAQSLMAQADILSNENEYSKVLEKANVSLVLSERLEDYANVVRSLNAVMSTQLTFGNYRESLDATHRALKLAESLPPDPRIIWPIYHEAAMSFYLLGMPMTALEFEKRSLRIATDAGLLLHASRSYDRLAVLCARMRKYEDAIKYSEQARVEAQKVSDWKGRTNMQAHAARVLGDSYTEFGDPKRAIAFYDEALELYGKLKVDDIYRYRTHKGKLRALMALNDNAAAEPELESMLYWFEKNRDKIAEESYRNKFFDTDQSTYDIAVDFAFTRKGDAEKAFDYAETSRARSLLDLITRGARVNQDQDRPVLKLTTGTSPLTLSQIQSQLPAQTQLLQYAVLDDRLIAWVITRDNLRSAQTPITRAELDRKVANYLDALIQRSNTNVSASGGAKDLYATLISPIESYLRRDLEIAIVPADNLNFVPFASLVSPSSGRYLIEDYTLSIAPSATVFIRASEQASRKANITSERLLVVGNPSFDHVRFPNLPDLPAATREAESIASSYGTNALINDDATRDRVKQGLADREVAHFATHAISDEQSPLLSKLLLAGGRSESHHATPGYLQASEIYELNLPRTRLVVLSACQTGIERAYRGEGAIGLARPFLAAGVPLIVASLWPVESDATADLMISFHKHRRQGKVSTVQALRRAQLDAIHRQDSNSPKNYEWAAFVAIGGYASF